MRVIYTLLIFLLSLNYSFAGNKFIGEQFFVPSHFDVNIDSLLSFKSTFDFAETELLEIKEFVFGKVDNLENFFLENREIFNLKEEVSFYFWDKPISFVESLEAEKHYKNLIKKNKDLFSQIHYKIKKEKWFFSFFMNNDKVKKLEKERVEFHRYFKRLFFVH